MHKKNDVALSCHLICDFCLIQRVILWISFQQLRQQEAAAAEAEEKEDMEIAAEGKWRGGI